jgi:histone H3/H4
MPKVKRRRSLQKQAIREIRKFQDKGKFATKQLIAKSCFRRLARGIAADYHYGLRFREDALDGLQEAVESQIVRLLANANKVAVAEGRMTLQPKDLAIAKSIMEDSEINIPARERIARVAVAEAVDDDDDDDDNEQDDDDDEEDEGYVLVHAA